MPRYDKKGKKGSGRNGVSVQVDAEQFLATRQKLEKLRHRTVGGETAPQDAHDVLVDLTNLLSDLGQQMHLSAGLDTILPHERTAHYHCDLAVAVQAPPEELSPQAQMALIDGMREALQQALSKFSGTLLRQAIIHVEPQDLHEHNRQKKMLEQYIANTADDILNGEDEIDDGDDEEEEEDEDE